MTASLAGRRCGVIFGGETCTDTAVYRMRLEDCVFCRRERGWLWCGGHWICVGHGADARTGAVQADYDDTDRDAPVSVERISATYRKAS